MGAIQTVLTCVLFSAVLSIAPALALTHPGPPAQPEEHEKVSSSVAVQRVSFEWRGLRDEAMMVLVGTALIGLAAALRRAA